MKVIKKMPRAFRAWRAARIKPLTFKQAKHIVAGEKVTRKSFLIATQYLDKYPLIGAGKIIPGKMSLLGRKKFTQKIIPLLEPNRNLLHIIFNTKITHAEKFALYEKYCLKKYGSKEAIMAELLASDLHFEIDTEIFRKSVNEEVKKRNLAGKSVQEFYDNFGHFFFESLRPLTKLRDEFEEKLEKELNLPYGWSNESRWQKIAELRRKAKTSK